MWLILEYVKKFIPFVGRLYNSSSLRLLMLLALLSPTLILSSDSDEGNSPESPTSTQALASSRTKRKFEGVVNLPPSVRILPSTASCSNPGAFSAQDSSVEPPIVLSPSHIGSSNTITVFSPKYDPAFKCLFGDKDSAASCARTRHFLNSIYFPEDSKIQKVTILPPLRPALPDEGRDIFFDVLCEDAAGKKFIIEMQKRHHKEFFRRLVFYSARQLMAQWDHLSEEHREPTSESSSQYSVKYVDDEGRKYATTNQYSDLCPVWTLAITDYSFLPPDLPAGKAWNPIYASINWDYSPHTRATDMMRWCFLDLTRPIMIPEDKQSCQKKPLNAWYQLFNITDHKACKSKAILRYPIDDELTGGILEVKSGYECLGRLPPETQAAIEAAVLHEADWNSVLAEERERGAQKKKIEMVSGLLSQGVALAVIAKAAKISVAEVNAIGKQEKLAIRHRRPAF